VRLASLALLALVAHAYADARTDQLATGYDKEAAACKIHADGVGKVLAGAKELPDEAASVDALDKAAAANQEYCDALAAVLALLRADPGATYKSLEKQLDDADNKIRKLRKSSKAALDGVQPVIAKLIPKINAARVAQPPAGEKHVPGTFPSGRKVDLPSLPGKWTVSGSAATDVLEYDEGQTNASVTVKAFSGATCDQQKKSLADKKLEDVAPTDAQKQVKLAWYVAYTQKARVVQVACVAGKAGGWIATVDAPIDAKLPLGTVMSRMLAGQIAQP